MKPFRTIPETIALFKRRCGECEQQAAQAKNQIEFAKYSAMANTYWKAAQELQYNTKEGWRQDPERIKEKDIEILAGPFQKFGDVPMIQIGTDRKYRKVYKDAQRDELFITYKGVRYYESDFAAAEQARQQAEGGADDEQV